MNDSQIDYEDNLSLFRLELTNLLGVELVKAKLFANGDINFSTNWKENTVQAMISAGVILTIGIITILVAVGVTVLMPGITIPISLAGVALSMGYTTYRTDKKQKEYNRINELFSHRKPEGDLAVIVDNITAMYQQTIKSLAIKDIPLFAKQFSKVMIRSIKKDKVDKIDKLLNSDSLYALLISEKKHISKDKIALEIADNQKRNCRSAIVKPAIYSQKRPHNVYKQPGSRPEKYGLLFFERSANFKKVLDTNANYTLLSMDESEKLIAKSGFDIDANMPANSKNIEESERSFGLS